MVEIKEEFRKRLCHAMDARNIKAIELSKKTGVSEATISQYKSGYSKPKDQRLVLIAEALGVDPAWLMGLNVPMTPAPAATSAPPLQEDERELLSQYRVLNDTGKAEAIKRVGELCEIEKYTQDGGGTQAISA